MSHVLVMILACFFGLIAQPSVVGATPTPTPIVPPTPLGGAFTQMGNSGLLTAAEPAVTLFPFGQSERAVVFANGNVYATYDLTDGVFELVTFGTGPEPSFPPYNVHSDPVAVTQPDGPVHMGQLAISDTNGIGSLLVWHSMDGLQWSFPSHVIDYTFPSPPRVFPDKPWLDVSRLSGRLWMIWNRLGGPALPCIATSLDGSAWSAPNCTIASVRSVAVHGPDSAVAITRELIGPNTYQVHSTRCTGGSGQPPPTPQCSNFGDIGTRRSSSGGFLFPGVLRAGGWESIAGDDVTGEVMVVWEEQDQPVGQPVVHSRVVWSHNTGTGWTTPTAITSPSADQMMPEIAFAPDAGEFVATLYQRQGTTNLFDVHAFQFRRTAGKWISLGTVGNPASATVNSGFLGDYSWVECPRRTCAVAFTGTNPTTNNVQIEIEAVPVVSLCVGDCDNNHIVFGTEITTEIGIWGGQFPLDQCLAADANVDGFVTMTEVTRSVTNLGLGCPNDPGVLGAPVGVGSAFSGSVTVDIGEVGGTPGQNVVVPISMSGSQGSVATVQVDILFGTASLSIANPVTACALGPGLQNQTIFASLPPSPPAPAGMARLRVGVGDLSYPISTVADGLVASCTFGIKSTAPVGTTTLTGAGQEAGDGSGNILPSQVSNGSVQVCGGCGCS